MTSSFKRRSYFLNAFLITFGRRTKRYLTSISTIAFTKFVMYALMFETLSVGRS